MAERRDYLLRMIEQMGAVFTRIRQLILGGSSHKGELQIAATRAGVDLGTARVLDVDSLLALLSTSGEADPTRTWLTAEFVYLEGLGAETTGAVDDALAAYRKARRLFLAIDPRVIGGIPEARARILELERRIGKLQNDRASDFTM